MFECFMKIHWAARRITLQHLDHEKLRWFILWCVGGRMVEAETGIKLWISDQDAAVGVEMRQLIQPGMQ